MLFYRFKTFKSTYYFPPLTSDSRFIYSLYGNYGGRAAHLLWWLFLHISLFRNLFQVKEEEIEGLSRLRAILGDDVIFGVNMGTIGPDQKMSVLGYHTNGSEAANKSRFFAKFATSERAKALSRNEIKVYQALAATGLVPALYAYQDAGDYVFLKCECFAGVHVEIDANHDQVMKILKTLKGQHYAESSSAQTCFAHMDFCPWNMLSVNGKLRVIDWEMAAEMPLGFDLFTYLLQTSFLIDKSQSGRTVIDKHRAWIDEYFAGEEWQSYLQKFVDYKVTFFSDGQNQLLYDRYREMQQSMK